MSGEMGDEREDDKLKKEKRRRKKSGRIGGR